MTWQGVLDHLRGDSSRAWRGIPVAVDRRFHDGLDEAGQIRIQGLTWENGPVLGGDEFWPTEADKAAEWCVFRESAKPVELPPQEALFDV